MTEWIAVVSDARTIQAIVRAHRLPNNLIMYDRKLKVNELSHRRGRLGDKPRRYRCSSSVLNKETGGTYTAKWLSLQSGGGIKEKGARTMPSKHSGEGTLAHATPSEISTKTTLTEDCSRLVRFLKRQGLTIRTFFILDYQHYSLLLENRF